MTVFVAVVVDQRLPFVNQARQPTYMKIGFSIDLRQTSIVPGDLHSILLFMLLFRVSPILLPCSIFVYFMLFFTFLFR